MGWSQQLYGSEKMTDDEIDGILNAIGNQGDQPWANQWKRQHLGDKYADWHGDCDVSRWDCEVEGTDIVAGRVYFSGAYFSANSMAPQRFETEAKHRGFKVRLGNRSH